MVVKENGQVTDVTDQAKGRTDIKNPRKKGFVRWTVGLIVRLCIWYALVTPFLRCPSHLANLTETSPRVCKPYLIARSHVEPYVTPYYNTYAAPYVDQARPYVEVFNERVYTPASKVARSGYEKYGAPALEQAQAYGVEQWQHQVTPRLQTAQNKVYQLYLTEADPYVQQSVAVVSPYYQRANAAVLTVYQGHLVPFYAHSKPFIGKAYSMGQSILTTHVMPRAQYTWSSAVYFANSSLWPHITGLYSEQVEPQLVKIGQRLASYREGKRLRAVIEDVDSSTVQLVTSSAIKSQEQIHTTTTVASTSAPQPSAQPTLTPTEQAQQAREKIDSDLEQWQGKFSLAADKGIEDLEERIGEIVSALVASSANSHGQSLSTALQSVSAEQISSIKQHINELADSMPEVDDPEIEESTRDLLVREIRTSAISVRDRAHALREWAISFEDELVRRVTAAVDSTLDVLDSIRDLGLQEIGMRWAWMDGVTYKDWAKYHALKAQLEEWRNEIRNVGMNHKAVSDARAVASDILDQGMHEAEQAAREIVRLKDVGIWKIAAREVSDNFETRTEAPPARPKPQEETEESVEEATQEDSAHNEYSENVPQSHSAATSDDAYEGTPSSDAPSAGVGAEADFDDADEYVMNDDILVEEQPSAGSAFGVAAADANSHQAPILDDEPLSPGEKVSSAAAEKYSEAVVAASSVIYDTATPVVQSLVGGASSAFADSTDQAKVLYEIAKSQVVGQIAESSAPAHAQLLASIESAYSGSLKYATDELESKLRAVRATPTPSNAGPLARISSIASSRLDQGLSLASEQLAQLQLPATTASLPQEALEPFVLDAQRRYYEAVGLAHDHYSAFVSTASGAVYGSPTPTPAGSFKGIIEEAGSQYEHVSSLASASLAAVVASASSVISSADGGKAQGIIDDASSRYNAALSAASSSLSAASISASSAIYGTSTGPVESLSSQASENWENLISKASEQIYSAPTPYLQQVVNGRPQFEAVQELISELMVGKQPSFTESVLSKLHAAYETPYPAAVVPSAPSYINQAYESASSAAASVVSEAPSVEGIIEQANDELHAAVEAASVGIYGTPKGSHEKATDAAADAYSTASAQVSGVFYGKESGYLDVAKDAIENIQSTASAAIYGEEPDAMGSATIRLAGAVESAKSQLADLAAGASSVVSEAVETAASQVEDTTNSIKSAAASVKDEL
ncbi:unnamed protein product [Penicillium glandicola]